MSADVTVLILTKNEEFNLPHALESVSSFARRVVVVDSGSTDRTLEIAREAGADVYENEWYNYATQLNWGLDNTGIDTTWTFRLDADEVVLRRTIGLKKDEFFLNRKRVTKSEVSGCFHWAHEPLRTGAYTQRRRSRLSWKALGSPRATPTTSCSKVR